MKKETISKVTSAVLVGCFLIFLYVAMGATLLRENETFSYYENRNLAKLPEPTAEGLLDGSYFTGIDTYLKEHSAGRLTVLKTATAIDMNILRRPVVNDVVVCDGLLLPFKDYEVVDEERISSLADTVANRLRHHSDVTESYGGEFYYVAVPCQYVCYEDNYPQYLNSRSEYTEKSAAALFSRLEELQVNFIDMMEFFEREGRPADFTSTVDNHFDVRGGYYTYREIMERIISETDIRPDVLEEGEYELTVLSNKYLGSRSRKLFGMWDSDEKLAVIRPKEKIPFKRWNYGLEAYSMIYAAPQNQWDDVLYKLYMGGDVANTVIETDREELPDILIYGDSFTNAVECVTWCSFDTMYSLDFRYYDDMTLDEFIEKYRPDVVVCIRDYEAILSTTGNGQ